MISGSFHLFPTLANTVLFLWEYLYSKSRTDIIATILRVMIRICWQEWWKGRDFWNRYVKFVMIHEFVRVKKKKERNRTIFIHLNIGYPTNMMRRGARRVTLFDKWEGNISRNPETYIYIYAHTLVSANRPLDPWQPAKTHTRWAISPTTWCIFLFRSVQLRTPTYRYLWKSSCGH